MKDKMVHDVAVIGAGLSGLTVAYRLLQNGVDVHVYEARPRVGGRILTVSLNDVPVELGGQNILDGSEAQNLLNLVKELQVSTVSGKIRMQIHYDTGTKLIDTEQLLSQWQQVTAKEQLEKQLDDLETHSQNMAQVLQTVFADQPELHTFFATRLMGYEGLPVEELSPRYVKSLKHMLLKSFHEPDQDEPPYFHYKTIQGGMARLTEALKAKLGQRVSLEMPLKSLKKTPTKSYLLSFNNGQTIEVERVVLAIPCSVYSNIFFDGEGVLLSRLQDIQNVGYGKHSKLLVPMRIPEDFQGVYASERFWAFSLEHNIATMFYFSQPVGFTASTIQQVFERDRPFLSQFYQDLSLSPFQAEYARCEQFSAYQGPVGYNWYQDSYSRGSYSSISAKQNEIFTAMTDYQGEQVKTLFAPIDDRLFFAGEHTSTLMDVTGTMEAAVEAGERTARMCLLP